MKTPPDENQLVRYLDDEMDLAEKNTFEASLAADAELRAEIESMSRLGAVLRSAMPDGRDVPHPDFFNSQIQVRLAEEKQAHVREFHAPAQVGGWLGWMRTPWFAAAATAVIAVVAFGFWQDRHSAPTGLSVVLSTYAPNPSVHAHSFHSGEAQATVLMLDGLASVPPDRQIVGQQVHHSDMDRQVATTPLFSDEGRVLLVRAVDGRNQPRLLEHTR